MDFTRIPKDGLQPVKDPATRDKEAEPAAGEPARAWSENHGVNLRLSFPLFFARYYLTIVAGKERRSADRRKSERIKHPVATPGNMIFLGTAGVIIGLAVLTLMQFVAARLLVDAGVMVIP